METWTFVPDDRFPDATLTPYLHGLSPEMPATPRRAIIICPGGAYLGLSDRENEPVALRYLAAGLNVFVLRYSVGERAARFAPLIEAALAVKHVREHAAEYHIDPNYVFITGFSAGGHCAAMCGTLWNHPVVREAMGDAPEGVNRPTAMVLCYPVITGGRYTHRESIDAVCGVRNASEEEARPFSLELHVDATTPPAFLWHTFNDNAVSVRNTLLFIEAMTEAGVPFECHIYPDGVHGLSLCNRETWTGDPVMDRPSVAGWIDEAIRYVTEFRA